MLHQAGPSYQPPTALLCLAQTLCLVHGQQLPVLNQYPPIHHHDIE